MTNRSPTSPEYLRNTPLELNVSSPPSANDIWTIRHGRLVKTDKYKAWLRDAGWTVKGQMADERGFGKQDVEVFLAVPKSRRRDVDNFIKPTLDLLQHLQIFHNDNQVVRVVSGRADRSDVRIEVWPA